MALPLTPCAKFVKDPDGWHRYIFGDVKSLIDLALDTTAGNHEPNRNIISDYLASAGSGGSRDSFFNGYTIEKMKAALADPPEDLVSRVETLRDSISSIIVPTGTRRRRRSRLDIGDELCEMAWLRREPDGWSDVRTEMYERRVVRIAVNLSVHAGQKASHLMYRGAAAAALADCLEEQGVSVEVVAFSCCHDKAAAHPKTSVGITLKRSDRPMDLAALAFAASEIAYYRLIVMVAIGRMCESKIQAGWGTPVRLPSTDAADILIDKTVTCFASARDLLETYADQFTTTKK